MSRPQGYAAVVASAIGFATLALFGRWAAADGVNTNSLLFLRFGTAAVVMFAICFARRERLPRARALWPLIGMGAIGYVGQATCYLTALQYASAGLVALLLYLYPVLVAVLSVLFLRDRFTWPRVLALALALAGVALTAGPVTGEWRGVALALGAAAIYSVYIIVGDRVLAAVSPWMSSAVIFASAGAMSGVLMLFGGVTLPATTGGWGAMAGIVVLATLGPVSLFLLGVSRIGATNAALVSTLEPIVTTLLAAWAFNESLSALTLLGGALILLATVVVVLGRDRSAPPTASVV
ncbi:MAG: DMT family transporter [Anaerolineales bacterium]|nr:DMT family transporter [Anaerolineales bacterium]